MLFLKTFLLVTFLSKNDDDIILLMKLIKGIILI